MTGIYKITNKQTKQVYIGQAINIEERLKEHQQKRFIPIDMWINMLGIDNFEFESLEECQINELDEKEQLYIEQYNSRNNGYNKQIGGFNNSIGEGNGRALLSEEDVVFIRTAYQNHKRPKEIYECVKNKITYSQFQGVWSGRSWRHIMPEVFTEENKNWYIKEQNKTTVKLTKDEVLKYRKYYVNHTHKETYQFFINEKGPILKSRTFDKILCGDVRNNSFYNEIPIYNKKLKKWFVNNEPVSTILESEE